MAVEYLAQLKCLDSWDKAPYLPIKNTTEMNLANDPNYMSHSTEDTQL